MYVDINDSDDSENKGEHTYNYICNYTVHCAHYYTWVDTYVCTYMHTYYIAM